MVQATPRTPLSSPSHSLRTPQHLCNNHEAKVGAPFMRCCIANASPLGTHSSLSRSGGVGVIMVSSSLASSGGALAAKAARSSGPPTNASSVFSEGVEPRGKGRHRRLQQRGPLTSCEQHAAQRLQGPVTGSVMRINTPHEEIEVIITAEHRAKEDGSP